LGKRQLLTPHHWEPKVSCSLGSLEATGRKRFAGRPGDSEFGEWHIIRILF